MSSLVSNLNEILDIKEEIKDVIGTESDLFSEYPQLISNAIATGGQADLSYYVSKDELSACSYITMDDVSACGYVTATDLNNASYVTATDLNNASYITMADVSACSYVTVTDLNNASYVTITQLDSMSYATKDYVDDAIEAIVFPDPDLSAYVTKTELSSCGYITAADIPVVDTSSYVTVTDLNNASYVTKTELTNASYVTETYMLTYLSQWGQSGTYNLVDRVVGLEDKTTQLDNRTAYVESYILSYNTRIQNLENAGYVTQTSLSSNSYATTTYVIDKFNEITGQITATDKDIIPSESNTYTLGNSSHRYSDTYSYNYRFGYSTFITSGSDYGIQMSINGAVRYQWNMYEFTQTNSNNRNQCSLGTANQPWAYTYTNYLILNGQNAYTLFVTQDDLASRGFLTQHQDLSDYATIAYVTSKVPEEIDLSLYPTYTYLYSYVGAVVGDIETLLANI